MIRLPGRPPIRRAEVRDIPHPPRMYDEEVFGLHNQIVHELSLACWLVGNCLEHEECWSSPQARGHILRCCAAVVTCVGHLADRVCDQDPTVAAEVRRLAALLEHHGEQLDRPK
ncbi:hypothetical protein [Saccharopolyspora pogona]|uniref:hypothetical protein n=1 Tax=Saccharopolyspora pogona TaxID=333966 RepID=UPI0016847D8C|nr:hypothetical protein [Saccharopolyspora pogona]